MCHIDDDEYFIVYILCVFVMLENFSAYSDLNVFMLTYLCNAVSIPQCLILPHITVSSINLRTWKMLILYFINSSFGCHHELDGRVSILPVIGGSGPVGKMNRWTSLSFSV